MRLKIIRDLTGSVDGIQLQRFIRGEIYDVSTSFGSYLLAERAAVPVPEDDSPSSPERADDRGRPPRLRRGK